MPDPLTWLLKLEAQTDGAAKFTASLQAAERGLHTVDAATTHAEQSTKKASHAHGEHAESLGHLESAFHHLVSAGIDPFIERAEQIAEFEFIRRGVDALLEAPEEILDKIKEVTEEIIKASSAEERITKSFELNLGVKGGDEAVEYAEKFAKNTEFVDDQAKDFASSLIQAGVKLEDLDKFMAAAGDVAARSKNPVEGMASAIEALSRAELSGNLDGRSLRRLHIGIPQLRELEEFKDKTDAQMKAILSDGAITKDQVFRAIAGPDNVVGDAAVEMSKTMGAQLAKLRNLPEQYFEKFAKSEGFDNLKAKVGEILSSLDPDGDRGGRIFASLERTFDTIIGKIDEIDFEQVANEIETEIVPDIEKVAKIIGDIDWVGGAKTLYGYVKDTKDIIDQIVDGAKLFKDILRDYTPIGFFADKVKEQQAKPDSYMNQLEKGTLVSQQDHGAVANWINRKTPVGLINDVMGVLWDKATGTLEAPLVDEKSKDFQDAMPFRDDRAAAQDAAAASDKAADAAGHAQSKFEDAGHNAGLGYVIGLRAGKAEAAAAGAELADEALDATNKAQESQSPSRKFRRAGRFGGEGYALGLGDAEDMATQAGRDVADAALDGAGALEEDFVGAPIGFDMDEQSGASLAATAAFAAPVQGAPPLSYQPADLADRGQSGGPAGAGQRPIQITMTFHIGDVSGGRRGADQADEMMARFRTRASEIVQGMVEQFAIEAGV